MDSIIVALAVLIAFGLLIILWELLKQSKNALIRVRILPFVTATIFTAFKAIQAQGDTLDKGVIVFNVVSSIYPQLPPYIRRVITKVMFQAIVEETYLFVERHCSKFVKLIEAEFSELN